MLPFFVFQMQCMGEDIIFSPWCLFKLFVKRGVEDVAPYNSKMMSNSYRDVWFKLNIRRCDVLYCYNNCRGDSRIARKILNF